MGLYTRPDSRYWWLWLETTGQKERTDIRVGTTAAQRHDSRQLAEDRYHQRMNELAARLYKLPSAQPAIRFGKYADTYQTDVIALHKGHRREAELLKNLRAFFSDHLLTAIDADAVRAYMKARRATVSAVTVNREVDLLKSMVRDAVPKYLGTSPLIGLRRLPAMKPKRRMMTRAEERKLLKAGEDPQDRAILILGVDTLIRLGDLIDLERSARHGPWLYVRDPKGGDPYEVALSARAAKALDAIPPAQLYYFAKFRKAQNPRDWTGSVRQRLQYLCEKANVPYGRRLCGITFHWATRRTGATRLLIQKKVPLPVVQRQGNWKNPDVLLEMYAEAQRPDLLKAVGAALPHRSRAKRKRA